MFMLFPFLFLSPWYNCSGWLGVKHQITYIYFCCLSLVEVMGKNFVGGGGQTSFRIDWFWKFNLFVKSVVCLESGKFVCSCSHDKLALSDHHPRVSLCISLLLPFYNLIVYLNHCFRLKINNELSIVPQWFDFLSVWERVSGRGPLQ